MPINFLKHVNRYVKLNELEQEQLLSYISVLKVSKKAHLFKEGHICNANYFVLKGCIRMYYINDKGLEQTTQFAIENWWLTDYQSLDSQKPSQFFLQAVELSELVVFHKQVQEDVFRNLPQLERYFRLVLQRAVGAAQTRIKYFQDYSGSERYLHFSRAFPEFVQRVPQYMLASYLNISAEFLSKVRAGKV